VSIVILIDSLCENVPDH